mmetsp:Transcript_407/g.955  ORF Transcript_407/g.955 Transcript_407/m.955 type:complete len:215 (+) Transcript_407:190-834(+)
MPVMQFWCLVLSVVPSRLSWPRSTWFWNLANALAVPDCCCLGAAAAAPPPWPSSFLTSFHAPPSHLNSTGVHSWPAAMMVLSSIHSRHWNGRPACFTLLVLGSAAVTSATHSDESWPTNATLLPDGDHSAWCTQPLARSSSSRHSPNGILVPKPSTGSVGRLSTPLTSAEKMRQRKSVDAVHTSMSFGCHSTLSTVERCFLMCFDTHQSCCSSK